MFERYQGRLYVTLHCAFCFFCGSQQFDLVAELGGEVDVVFRNGRDALCRDVFRSDADTEDDGHEDRQFIGYIDAFYIAGRISFRKAFFLGILQDVFVIQSVFCHLRQNIVRSTVYDTENFIEIVG